LLPYWLLFSLFAVGAVSTRQRTSVRRWNPLLIFAGVVATLMIGLRDQVGADWHNYERIFLYTGLLDLGDALGAVDPAYAFLNWMAYSAGFGIWIVNVICGAIFVWGLLVFANRQPNPWLCIVVAIPYLVIVVGMGYTRQAVALGLIMAGLADLERRSMARFIFLIVCAAVFHKTAIIILPLVAFSTLRNRFIVLTILGAVGFLLFTVFFERAVGIITASYLEQDYDASGAFIRVFMNVIPAIIYLIWWRRFQVSPLEQRLWRNYSWAALALVPLLFLAASSVIADRLAIYIIPLQLFILGRLPWAFPDQGRPNGQIALLVVIYAAMVQATWLMAAEHAEHWLPYKIYEVGQKYRPPPEM
jgi:hypothetical protein